MRITDASEWVLYVIGLERRGDRREWVERALGVASIPCEVRFASDLGLVVDWRDLSPTVAAESAYGDWRIDTENPWWNRALKLGEIACSLSHLRVWDLANRSGHNAIILEDDATTEASFGRELQRALEMVEGVDPDWGLLYLGRERLAADSPTGTPGLVRPGYSYCSYGYCLSRAGLRAVTTADLASDVIPVDEFLPSTYLTHPRADIADRFPPRLVAYALAADIVGESGSRAKDSDTERSPFLR